MTLRRNGDDISPRMCWNGVSGVNASDAFSDVSKDVEMVHTHNNSNNIIVCVKWPERVEKG